MKPEHFRAHPWHGVTPGDRCPEVVTAYIEIVPTDTVKFEVDKASGILRIDRPQRYSNICPAMYGFIPQTLCGDQVAKLCVDALARTGADGSAHASIVGDADPVDICVLTERVVHHGDILVSARPIGGLRLVDKGEADDKLIAVLEGDPAFDNWRDITDCPAALLNRLSHYFLTYKLSPETMVSQCQIVETFSRAEAYRVIEASIGDYRSSYWGTR
jgi:inorganic pyrophosphatase